MHRIPLLLYYCSICFGQPFCPSSGVLSRTSALVHFMQLWPFAATPDSKRSQPHKMYQSRCTAKSSWWAERLPETCRVIIPIKLEFNASVGFIHKELRYLLGFYNSTVEVFFFGELCTISWWLLSEMQGSKCPKKEA